MKVVKIDLSTVLFLFALTLSVHVVSAQETVRYTGAVLSNIDYHHGQLRPVVGVHNIQVLRANREHPEKAEGTGWTYNHAPMLAYWNNTFYLEYLSTPVGEHVPPGQTLLVTSANGTDWSKPVVIFPPYRIPDGTTKQGYPGVAKNLDAVMHQRMGFYISKKKRLLALAYYGIAMDAADDPNDGKGIGRVVREVFANGTYGPIYFIRHNASWDQEKSVYLLYTKSKDKGFIEACNELMADPLMMMQWVEEADRNDPIIPLKKEYKAFSYYRLPDKRVVGLWKHALTTISDDGGKTWPRDAIRAPGFVNSNAKIWGQRTADGRYATVYNPSEYRWPLAISTSDDGLNYTDLLLIHGEISPRRYHGHEKSYGPQYVTGILEGNGSPPGHNVWVTYSMNKEDIWVSSIPVPVKSTVEESVNDVFAQMPDGRELDNWNIGSPRWAPVAIEKMRDGTKVLALNDSDPYDFARAERIIPASKKVSIEFGVRAAQDNAGVFHIEFQDSKGSPAIRLVFDSTGRVQTKSGAKFRNISKYKAGEQIDFTVEINTETRSYTVEANGKAAGTFILYAPASEIERVVFRTGPPRNFPDPETPANLVNDLPNAGEQEPLKQYYIPWFKATKAEDRRWSVRMAQSEMKRFPRAWQYDSKANASFWGYHQGVVLKAVMDMWKYTGDKQYYTYALTYGDSVIAKDGTIKTYKAASYNIDMIAAGKILFPLYAETGSEKFAKAIHTLREQMRTQPRTSEGGFWHKLRYPHQMWLDGLYMASPFLAQYARDFREPALFDDVVNQFRLIARHTYDPKTGLYYHAWDERKEQKWANKETGQSPNFWGRSMGWFAMALVDAMDYLPKDHPGRQEIIQMINQMAGGIRKYQDVSSGVWYQVVDQGNRPGNYLESTASSMFVYFLYKATRHGYLDKSYLPVAQKGFDGLIKNFIREEPDGTLSLSKCCAVAGLGGDPYRDGSYEYYIGERIRDNDPKGIGPFIWASMEHEMAGKK